MLGYEGQFKNMFDVISHPFLSPFLTKGSHTPKCFKKRRDFVFTNSMRASALDGEFDFMFSKERIPLKKYEES